MRLNINDNDIFADMNYRQRKDYKQQKNITDSIKDNWGILLGITALILSILNVPFDLIFIIMRNIFETGTPPWTIFLFVLSIIMICSSITCGLFSIIFFMKSKKQPLDIIGLVCTIIAFAVCITCLVFTVIEFMA